MVSRHVLISLVLAALASISSAFVAAPPSATYLQHVISQQQRQRPVTLNMVTEINNDKPKDDWRTLPNRSVGNESDGNPETTMSAEIYIGRIAMLGFVGLVVGEVLTGESFSQQFLDAGLFLIGAAK